MGNDDVARLRASHPLWSIGSAWTAAASGPDKRRFTATRDNVTVSAWTAAELSIKIREEEAVNGWPPV
jgi:hypothetical protein